MEDLPYYIWGIACLIAAIGTVYVFRSEDRHTIADQRRTILVTTRELVWQRRENDELRSRLSQLMPIDTAIDRITEHERSKSEQVYDQESTTYQDHN
jgi:hypothetical protein